MCLIVDKDANPSTKVHRNATTSSDMENVITVEVNNKYEVGHTLLIAKIAFIKFGRICIVSNFSERQYFGQQQ